VEQAKTLAVVLGCRFKGGYFRFTEVHANGNLGQKASKSGATLLGIHQTLSHSSGSLVIKSHAIDGGLIIR
jgi:hypothetical protein